MRIGKHRSERESFCSNVTTNAATRLPYIQHRIARSGMQLAFRHKIATTTRCRTSESNVAKAHHRLRHFPCKIFHDIGIGMELPHYGMPAQGLAQHKATHGREAQVGWFHETVITRILWHGEV